MFLYKKSRLITETGLIVFFKGQEPKGQRERAKCPSGKELLANTEETTVSTPITDKVVEVELASAANDNKTRNLTTARGNAPNGAKSDNGKFSLQFWVSSGQS